MQAVRSVELQRDGLIFSSSTLIGFEHLQWYRRINGNVYVRKTPQEAGGEDPQGKQTRVHVQ